MYELICASLKKKKHLKTEEIKKEIILIFIIVHAVLVCFIETHFCYPVRHTFVFVHGFKF